MEPLIVIPYINETEITELRHRLGWKLPAVFWKDIGRIGSDLAYQTLWNKYSDRDIIILHADMLPLPNDINNDWYYELCNYASKHKEAGIFGTTLLYPSKDENNKYYIQHAGGRFINDEAVHFGGGLDLFSATALRQLEADNGQYDKLREVSWVTFGGIYIRRDVLSACGDFDATYYWTYYRDVDYCLSARSLGYKIYQTPVKLLHYEGRDNKRIQSMSRAKQEQISINHNIFVNKWKGSSLLETIDIEIPYEKE